MSQNVNKILFGELDDSKLIYFHISGLVSFFIGELTIQQDIYILN